MDQAKRLLRWLLAFTVLGGSLMVLSGEWRSPYMWGLIVALAALGLWVALRVLQPDLARERFHPPTRGADPVALLWIRLSALSLFVFGPLDGGRLHWSAPVPPVVRVIGIAGFVVGCFVTMRAMAANQFFSSVIRVQNDRGHYVIDRGPYATIRHPGYLGMALFAPMSALALGSWWALIPAGVYTVLILRRAAMEDRFLRANLSGYTEYAKRVRFRVVPGIW